MSWAIPILRWGDKLVLCAKADEMFMRTVQQNVLLVLNSVPVTFVTDPEHSLDGKLWQERRRQEIARLRLLETSKRR